MELCGLSLEDYLRGQTIPGLQAWETVCSEKGTEIVSLEILSHILSGLFFIHSSKMAHRDLCPSNGNFLHSMPRSYVVVLWKNGYWKIADFGLTSDATSNRLITTSTARGKPSYRPPELLRETGTAFNHKSDMWSFGCIAVELFTGKKAFEGDYAVFAYALSGKTPREIVKNLSPLPKAMIQNLLLVDPENRPSIREMIRRLTSLTNFANLEPTPTVEVGPRKRRRRTISETEFRGFPILDDSLKWAFLNDQPLLFIELLLHRQITPGLLYQTESFSETDTDNVAGERDAAALLFWLGDPNVLGRLLSPLPTTSNIARLQIELTRAILNQEFKLASLILRGILKLDPAPPFPYMSPGVSTATPNLDSYMMGILRHLGFRLSVDKHREIIGELYSLMLRHQTSCFEVLLAISDILPAELVPFRTLDCVVVTQHSTQKALNSLKLVDVFDASLFPRVMKFSEDGGALHIAVPRIKVTQWDFRKCYKGYSIQGFPLRCRPPEQSSETGLDQRDTKIDTNIVDMHIGRDIFCFIGANTDLPRKFSIHQVPLDPSEECLTSPIVDRDMGPVMEVKFSHTGTFIAYSTRQSLGVCRITLSDRKSQVLHEWEIGVRGSHHLPLQPVRLKFSPGDEYLCANDYWGPLHFFDPQTGTLRYLVDISKLYDTRVSPLIEYAFIPSNPKFLAYRTESPCSQLHLLHFPTAAASIVIEQFHAHHIMFSSDGLLMAALSIYDSCQVQLWDARNWQFQATILIRGPETGKLCASG